MWVMLTWDWVGCLALGAVGWKKCGVAKKLKALRRALNESKKFTKF